MLICKWRKSTKLRHSWARWPPSITKAKISGSTICTGKEVNEEHSFFRTRKLEGRLSFELEIVCLRTVASQSELPLTRWGTPFSAQHQDALSLHISNGLCPCKRKALVLPFTNQEIGWRILVNVDMQAREVEWVQLHPYLQTLLREQIPIELFGKTLLPVLHIWCSQPGSV